MKFKFLLVAALVSSAAVAQYKAPGQIRGGEERSDVLGTTNESAVTNEGSAWLSSLNAEDEGVIIMSEDFAAGVPATWSNISLSGGAGKWEYRGPSVTPNANVGSRGAYATGLGPIQSTTRTNGFMIFDSDYLDNGGTAGGTGQEAATAHKGALTSAAIDCSTHPFVILTFQSYTRNFNSDMLVIVSNDGFTTTDTVWNGYDFTGTNEQSATNDFVRLDVSAVAGGEANFQVRFAYIPAINNNPAGYYFWMIDDIKVSTVADWDLALDEVFFNGAGSTIANFQGASQYYNRIPLNQVQANGITFGAAMTSWGGQTQMNSKVTATVSGAGSFSSSSTPANLNSFETDTVDVQNVFTPSSLGAYTVDFEVSSDSADDYAFDNESSTDFEVTEHLYAWDNDGVDNGVSWSNGTMSIYARFDVFETDTVSAVEFAVWSSNGFASSDQSVVQVGVWPITGYDANFNVVADLNSPIASKFYTISQSEFNTVIRVAMDAPVAIPAGVTEVLVGYRYQAGLIRAAMSDVTKGFFNSWLDVESDGTIDGWIDYVPVIHLETWSSDICANTTIVLDHDVTCNRDDYSAEIQSIVSSNGSTDFTYNWSTGQSTESITTSTEGTYSFTVTDGNFCEASHTFTLNNSEFNCNLAVGELDNASFGFSVVPNPSNGSFNVLFSAEKSERAELIVQGLKGEIVYQTGLNLSDGLNANINLSDLAKGVYYVKVVGESSTSVEKIVIQ